MPQSFYRAGRWHWNIGTRREREILFLIHDCDDDDGDESLNMNGQSRLVRTEEKSGYAHTSRGAVEDGMSTIFVIRSILSCHRWNEKSRISIDGLFECVFFRSFVPLDTARLLVGHHTSINKFKVSIFFHSRSLSVYGCSRFGHGSSSWTFFFCWCFSWNRSFQSLRLGKHLKSDIFDPSVQLLGMKNELVKLRYRGISSNDDGGGNQSKCLY